jgi:hypothetical protein
MANRLFIFGGFAHDSQGVVAAIDQLAFVGIERGFNRLLGVALELGVAALAYGEEWWTIIHDSQFAFRRHDHSLAHAVEGE